jgi:hypothetical protein
VRVPDAAANGGNQYQGDGGTDDFAYVHDREMMTSSDDDIKTSRPRAGRDAPSGSFPEINGCYRVFRCPSSDPRVRGPGLMNPRRAGSNATTASSNSSETSMALRAAADGSRQSTCCDVQSSFGRSPELDLRLAPTEHQFLTIDTALSLPPRYSREMASARRWISSFTRMLCT